MQRFRPGLVDSTVRTFLLRLLPLALPVVAACSAGKVSIQVTIPDQAGVETPVPGVRLTLLPYDRDSLLQVLENRAPSPRPSTARLDTLFQQFRAPFEAYLQASLAARRLQALVDTARARGGNVQGEVGNTLRRLEDSLATLTQAAEKARKDLAVARERLQPGIDSLRSRIRAWEDTAYRAYDSISAAITSGVGHDAASDSTRADGWASVKLPRKGPWWVYARAVNVQDPNAEWYWNIKVAGDTVRLSSGNGRSRTRF